MSLDHLWAGWRAGYVATVSGQEVVADDGAPEPTVGGAAACVFCRIAASSEGDDVRHVVHTTAHSIVLMNAYPYASGHVLVMPIRHVSGLGELSPAESGDLWQETMAAVQAIEAAYQPEGLNLGANIGRAAGAGIPAHLHLHVVPRWVGDTNFMTAVASVRVLPEALADSWAKLRANWPT